MAAFQFTNSKGIEFKRNPRVAKATRKGWVIEAFSTDPAYYGGHYVAVVGVAAVLDHGYTAFHLKRDAKAALAEAIEAGLFA